MSYKILPTREFEGDFYKLDKEFQVRIIKKINEIAQDPTRYKHLSLDLKRFCRVRIGKLRVLFSYEVEKQELYLEKIIFGHKY
jgi:mRNA-degrading endonuclease RelE of RelBE toxin-antitoxin system|tara:strand:+ start:3359 stop:3607 length:249 start_codon:yes stop_codon:yes gene_type:complete